VTGFAVSTDRGERGVPSGAGHPPSMTNSQTRSEGGALVVGIEQIRQLAQAIAVGTACSSVLGPSMQVTVVSLVALDLVTRWGWRG
jgi:hypothetical protein